YNKKATSIHYYFGNAVLVIISKTTAYCNNKTISVIAQRQKERPAAHPGAGLSKSFMKQPFMKQHTYIYIRPNPLPPV
ncbi:MAG: hypothetical protein LUG59_10275, partial [Enterocloster clostridioformis]|nr:hypothetical protein [Enterocloster clostridioformis]